MKNFALHPILMVIATSGALSAQPAVTAVLNAASFSAAVSPGAWITIFGNNLAAAPVSSPSLPTTLSGVSMTVGGQAAPLSYVSPNQVNALIPFETAIPANTVVPVVITSSGGSITYNIRLTRDAPGIFTLNGAGTGPAIISNPDGLAAVIGGYDYIFYATGLGPVNASGSLTDSFDVYLGEHKALVSSATPVSDRPGVYRIQITAPAFLASDRLFLASGVWQSNIVDVPIRPGSSTANVSGSIDGLYPSSNPFFTLPMCISDDPDSPPCSPGQDFSVMLHAGTFSVAFDILPSAPPFEIAAVGEAGGTIISFNPPAGYTASLTVPTAAARTGNFQDSPVPLWDYSSCSPPSAQCVSFPANLIPPSRLSPYWLQATQALPPPGTGGSSPNVILQSTRSLSGSHFAIDAQNHAELSKFGGIIQVPYGPFDTRVSTFKLYVDGRLVATKNLPYTVVHR